MEPFGNGTRPLCPKLRIFVEELGLIDVVNDIDGALIWAAVKELNLSYHIMDV